MLIKCGTLIYTHIVGEGAASFKCGRSIAVGLLVSTLYPAHLHAADQRVVALFFLTSCVICLHQPLRLDRLPLGIAQRVCLAPWSAPAS